MIPEIIHQIWSGKDGPLPDLLKEWGQSWIKYHPDWKYELWENDRINSFIREYFPQYVEIYDQFPYDIQRWDAIRYLILLKNGGMYVDFDYECLEPLGDILRGKECCFSMEPETHIHPEAKETSCNFNNALMACSPNHPFIMEIIKEVFSEKERGYPVNDKFHYVLSTTGPIILMNTYEKYAHKDDIYLIPSELVSPFGVKEIRLLASGIKNQYFEEKIKKAKALHYFWGSWKL